MRTHVLFILLLSILLSLPGSGSCSAQGTGEKADTKINSQKAVQGIYEISSLLDDGFVLDVRSCTKQTLPEQTLQMFRPLNVNQQKFYLEELSDSSWRISALHSGGILTAVAKDGEPLQIPVTNEEMGPESAALPDEDTNADGKISVIVRRSSDDKEEDDDAQEEEKEDEDIFVCLKEPDPSISRPAADQTWFLQDAGDGYFYIRSAYGYCLTLKSTALHNGAPLSLEPFSGRGTQKWHLAKTMISAQSTADTDLVNPYAPDGPYENLRLILRFGKKTETLTAADLALHVTEEDHQMTVDDAVFTDFAQTLAEKYDTQGNPRNFRTSYGETITLYQGNFGWKLDVEKTAEKLKEEAVHACTWAISPVWSHKGLSFDSDEVGDSYVEVDLSNQKVFLYKDGEKLLECDCVSGTMGTDRETPGGIYSIYYKQSPAVLRGPGYESPVTYWMPYNGGIGLHDANWRSSFGGDIYKTDGSHGCINLPTWAAEQIYHTVDIGYPVVSYW